jgi:hypothetical protein
MIGWFASAIETGRAAGPGDRAMAGAHEGDDAT